MKVIKTRVDQATYDNLVEMRKKAGLPSVSALFLKKCGQLNDKMEADEIVTKALTKAQRKSKGYTFRLRDLFIQDEWERFSKGARLRAGKMFFEKLQEGHYRIEPTEKSPSNHQLYEIK